MPTATRLLSFEQAVSATNVRDVQISPDGRQVAYVTTPISKEGEYPVSEIWLISAAGGSPRRLTTSEAADSAPRWSPDGRRIVFSSDRQERGTPQLYVLDLTGGEAVRLTACAGGAGEAAWSPDGSQLAFITWDVDTEEEKQRKAERDDARVVDADIKRASLWLLSVPGDPSAGAPDQLPEARRLNPEGLHIIGAPAWAPDGSRLVAAAAHTPKLDDMVSAELLSITLDGELRRLSQVEGIEALPTFSPDGSTIAFIAAEDFIPALGSLQTIPASGGRPRVVAPGFEGSFVAFEWLPEGNRILAGIETGERHAFLVIDPETGSASDAFEPFEQPGSGAQQFSISSDGTHIAFAFWDDLTFKDVYVAELGGHARKLTDLNPWVRDYEFGETREIAWKASDGLEIQGLLILPVGYQEGQRYPLVVWIHGGPTAAWTHRLYAGWNDLGQFMAQRGYAVFMPNPRGSSGRGTAFACTIVGCYGEPDSADIMSGVDYLIEQGIADPDQLVVGGSSGGGFLTNWLITRTDRFKAAVTGAGISNWASFMGTTDGRAYLDRYFGRVNEDFEVHWRLSPIRYIANATTPTLIRYGEADRRVPASQGYELYEGLKAQGVETQMVVYPREGHGNTSMLERKHQIDLLRRIVGWYDGHLGRA